MRKVAVALAVGLCLLPRSVGAATGGERAPYLVMFEGGVSSHARDALHSASGAVVTGYLPEVSLARVVVTPSGLRAYETSPLVSAIARPRPLRVLAAKPNDPLLYLQWPLRQIDAFDAWRVEDGKDPSVAVAVIDTGVDALHSDLHDRIAAGFDYLELDDNTYDDHGHGTHVAGVIAANTANAKGVAGLSRGTTIIPMKTCGSAGDCPLFGTYAGAIDAVRRGAVVINMSLGAAGECTEVDQAVFDWIREQGVVSVVAAGNSGTEGNPSIMPANCDNTLGVGAVNDKGRKAKFSSYGDFVDIAAPGVEVWSTLPPLISILSPYIGYGAASGTSMAAPHVAGAAALVKARHPEWTPEQIEAALILSAVDAGKPGRDDLYGHGLLNLRRALR